MDATECGIVKLPRVPTADNIPEADVPVFRDLWEHIRDDMPKKGRGKARAILIRFASGETSNRSCRAL
jgi:type III restriction enzyme